MENDQRAKLLEKKARIDAKLRALDQATRKQERRDDTRRKIIAGALVLEHATLRDDFAQVLAALLNRYVKRPEDRALFDFLNERLPDVPAMEEPAKPAATFGAAAAQHPEAGADQGPLQESA